MCKVEVIRANPKKVVLILVAHIKNYLHTPSSDVLKPLLKKLKIFRKNSDFDFDFNEKKSFFDFGISILYYGKLFRYSNFLDVDSAEPWL